MNEIDPKYLINLEDSELDEPIYRYISFDRLLQHLQSKQNILIKPFMWKDPFENYISKLVINDISKGNDPTYLMGFKHTFFAQCWTLRKECDLMWKSYVPNCTAVKLKTTIKKLYNSISDDSLLQIKMLTNIEPEVFIGKVKYIEKSQYLETGFVNWDIMVSKPPIKKEEVLKTLFLKREEFENEEEIRIVLNTKLTCNHKDINHLLKYPFNTKKFVKQVFFTDILDEIIMDPRIGKEKYQSLKEILKEMQKKSNYKFLIKHSDLYKFKIKDKTLGKYNISERDKCY